MARAFNIVHESILFDTVTGRGYKMTDWLDYRSIADGGGKPATRQDRHSRWRWNRMTPLESGVNVRQIAVPGFYQSSFVTIVITIRVEYTHPHNGIWGRGGGGWLMVGHQKWQFNIRQQSLLVISRRYIPPLAESSNSNLTHPNPVPICHPLTLL